MENLDFLFWGYTVGWAIILLYLFHIGRRESALRRKLAELQAMIEEKREK